MRTSNLKRFLPAIASLLLIGFGVSAHATTLTVNCGSKYGLTSISAAIRAIQSSESEGGRKTINVSGACHENVVIQSIDRLTLNALNGASITDASSGNLDVIQIADSRSVSINNFTINGSPGGASGINCIDGSLCRLNGNSIQGAVDGAGVAVDQSQLGLSGGTLQNNSVGLFLNHGANGVAFNVAIQNNPNGIVAAAHSFLSTNAVITSSSAGGVFINHNSMLACIGCQASSNGSVGVLVKRDSSARFSGGYVVTGNQDVGVELTEESSALFANAGTVTGNVGYDVFCAKSFTTARLATTNIGGGKTNCVEPSP